MRTRNSVSLSALTARLFAVLLSAAFVTGCASSYHSRQAEIQANWSLQAQYEAPSITIPNGDPVAECAGRRQQLAADLGRSGLVFLRAASMNGDERFFQSDDFWYLSNVDLPDVAMAMKLGEGGEILDEVLFLPEHSDRFERWNGPRLEPGAESAAATGFMRTLPLPTNDDDFAEALGDLGAVGTLFALEEPQSGVPAWLTLDSDDTLRSSLHASRLKKSEYELECLQASIDITAAAIHQALAEVTPGGHEYELQAAIDGTYLRLGSERPGFSSICAAGGNAVTLHYAKNRDRLIHGQLVLMDVGAKYRHYCADITRTVPISGRFTSRQRELYDLVLLAQSTAAEAARPGMTLRDLHAVGKAVLDDAGYGQYFLHGLSHWLGLDVHDVGGRVPIQKGYVFTIEPGLYIADEQIGIRIEDDYLMTAEGAVKLSGAITSDPDALEALLADLH
ncbi:MAG: Xaa-Pro aminopeptidase [Pseudohongiellaceae bacterium]|jgi:Xaa-Pro aminopeptidase